MPSVIFTTMFFVVAAALSPIALSLPLGLVEDGRSDWRIVPVTQSETANFSALELQKYIQKISGCRLPVSGHSAIRQNILIGLRSDLPREYLSILPAAAPGFDGYTLVISNSDSLIIIAGDNERGTLYGVYDLLEQLGCRWFYPTQDVKDPEVVPTSASVQVGEIRKSIASPVKYRIYNGAAWYFTMDYVAAAKQLAWAMKNRYNGIGWQADGEKSRRSLATQYNDLDDAGLIAALKERSMYLHGPAHSLDQFLSSDKYFSEHPEWFGMLNGKRVPQRYPGAQFCWSNPMARREAVNNAVNFILQAPAIQIFSVWPFDGGGACQCAECEKIGATNALVMLMNELADTLTRILPQVTVETIGGYGPVADPPSPAAKPNPNLRFFWAHWGRNHEVGYNDSAYDKTNLNEWLNIAEGGFTLCQYYTDNFAEPWVMGPFTTAMESDRKFFLSRAVDGFYALSYSPGFWWNHGLNGYLAGQAFYNDALNPYELIGDYAKHYYGEAAGNLMQNYFEAWASDIALSYRIRTESTESDIQTLRDQRNFWLIPASEATKGHPVYSYRIEKVWRLHQLAESIAATHALKREVQHARRRGEFKKAARLLARATIETDQVLFTFYRLADLNIGLVDRGDVAGFTKMAIQGWIDSETQLVKNKQRSEQLNELKPNETNTIPLEVTN